MLGGTIMPQLLVNEIPEKDLEAFSDLERQYLSKLYIEKLPRHVAIIMDGNGRWAEKRMLPGMPVTARVEALKRVVKVCAIIGIEVLTVYAFSTENWRRPKREVRFLMDLLVEYLEKEIVSLDENNVKVKISGNIEALNPTARDAVIKGLEKTKDNTGLIFNVALNYGGRMR